MWPWEHLAFGYLLWSLWLRARGRSLPGDWEALVLVFATQLPDLVDKPLAWQLGVLPGGRSLGSRGATIAGPGPRARSRSAIPGRRIGWNWSWPARARGGNGFSRRRGSAVG